MELCGEDGGVLPEDLGQLGHCLDDLTAISCRRRRPINRILLLGLVELRPLLHSSLELGSPRLCRHLLPRAVEPNQLVAWVAIYLSPGCIFFTSKIYFQPMGR